MESMRLTCIRCPRGCQLTVSAGADGALEVSGNLCARGKKYAADEATNPVRTVTSTVVLEGSERFKTVPVKTVRDVPKASVLDAVASLRGVVARPPVRIGDVVAPNFVATADRLV